MAEYQNIVLLLETYRKLWKASVAKSDNLSFSENLFDPEKSSVISKERILGII